VRQKSEQMARNENQLNYDETKSFSIDCRDFVPVYSGQPSLQCPYCGSSYLDEAMKNKPCLTCGLSAVGIKTLGLVMG
jgi:coatomer subunit alpha